MTPNAAPPASGPAVENACKADGTAMALFSAIEVQEVAWSLAFQKGKKRFHC
ncbi:hypothetical protein HGM15179_011340, partial [Zosterops borbonicus]